MEKQIVKLGGKALISLLGWFIKCHSELSVLSFINYPLLIKPVQDQFTNFWLLPCKYLQQLKVTLPFY